MKLDPVQIQILWNRLLSIVDEAATGLIRTAYTPAVKEYHDFCCAVFDADANMLAHSTVTTAGFLGIVPEVMRNFVKSYPEGTLKQGDVVLTNDPWLASGHLIDVTVAAPIWLDDRLIGYTLCIVHHLDMGGRMATLESRNIYEEGLKIPILKLATGGEIDQVILAFLKANIRVAEKVIGDIRAQLIALSMCERGILALLAEFGLADLRETSEAIISRTENSMRNKIAALPSGTYRSFAQLPFVPGCSDPIEIHVAVTVGSEEVVIDFAGTSGEVQAAVNCTLNMTRSYASYPIKLALDPDVPNNDGSLRRIKVIAPEGSVLNCRPPAATWGRTMISHLLPEIVFAAIESIIPDRVLASSGGAPANEMYLHGVAPDGRRYMTISQHSGGYGGGAQQDGASCLCFPNNTRNTPIEVTEAEASIVYLRKALIPNSAGPGFYRGGFGQVVEFEVLPLGDANARLESSVRVTGRTPEGTFPVSGRLGGGGGRGGGLWLNGVAVDHGVHRLLGAGDVIRFELGGGGGYGDPWTRELAAVENDVTRGLVSPEQAKVDYGVVIDGATGKVDSVASERLRSQKTGAAVLREHA